MKAKWLDRTLILSPVYYTLCTSEKTLAIELKRIKLKRDLVKTIDTGATTTFFCNDDGETMAIVCLFNHKYDIEQINAILAHEAVHIWQDIRGLIGEKNPSAEFEAYSIQKITQELLYEYKRQRGRKK